MSKTETFRKILIEVVSVVFAVLLALGLNHWREDLGEKKLAQQAFKNIVIEIKSNIRSLEDEEEDYQNQIDALLEQRKLLETGEKKGFSFGYNHPVLSNSAWTIANSTGAIKDMDLDVVLELSELYIFQEMFQDNGFSYFKVVTSPAFAEEPLNGIKSVIAQLEISRQFGGDLKRGFEGFLETYKQQIDEVITQEELEQIARENTD